MRRDGRRHIGVVVRVAVDAGGDEDGTVDAVAIHLPEQLLGRAARGGIGNRRS